MGSAYLLVHVRAAYGHWIYNRVLPEVRTYVHTYIHKPLPEHTLSLNDKRQAIPLQT